MTTRLEVSGATEQLAEFAAQLKLADVPVEVREHLKLCVLDTLGCGLFGTTLPWGRIAREFVTGMGGSAEATVWGTHVRVPASNAALANGTMIHGFELDDLHRAAILHPGSVAVSSAIAVGETDPAVTGEELLASIVAGYEVGVRVGMSLGTDHLLRGFHPTGTAGAVAAAAAAGRAMRLSPTQMVHALSIGATQGAGLMAAQYESMVKRMHAGRAAQSGVYAAHLARSGLIGIPGVFEQEYGGFCRTFAGEADVSALTRDLGIVFACRDVGFKIYACCGSCHTAVEGIRRIRAREHIAASDVEQVIVDTTLATQRHVGWPYASRGVTAAQMNMPYCVAVTLQDGEAFVDQFTEAKTRDPRLIDLAARVTVRHDPALDVRGPGARHTVRLRVIGADGRVFDETVTHAKGSSADPLTRDEVMAKFVRLATPIVGPEQSRAIADDAAQLERLPSLHTLIDRLGPTDG